MSKGWPYGTPEQHEPCCLLFEGAAYCDCKASAADDLDWGEVSHGVIAEDEQ